MLIRPKYSKNKGIVRLSGQLRPGSGFCLLPVSPGKCRCAIQVLEGDVRLNHAVFNPDGGAWSAPAPNNKHVHYTCHAGERCEIDLEIGYSFGRADHVNLENLHLLHPAVVAYSLEKVETQPR